MNSARARRPGCAPAPRRWTLNPKGPNHVAQRVAPLAAAVVVRPVSRCPAEGAPGVALYPPDAGVNANKIVVAGYSNLNGGDPSTANDFAVARLNTDGSLDTSFGVGGKTTVAFSGDDRAYGVAVDRDGKVVVVG